MLKMLDCGLLHNVWLGYLTFPLHSVSFILTSGLEILREKPINIVDSNSENMFLETLQTDRKW